MRNFVEMLKMQPFAISISIFLNFNFFAIHFELNFEPFAFLPLVCSTVHTSLNTKMLSNSSGAVRLPYVGCFVHK